jgi:hypothetical protein
MEMFKNGPFVVESFAVVGSFDYDSTLNKSYSCKVHVLFYYIVMDVRNNYQANHEFRQEILALWMLKIGHPHMIKQ